MLRVNVRRCQSADLDSIGPLFDMYRSAFGATSDIAVSTKFLADRMIQHESVIFLAELESLVGFAQLYPSFASISARSIWILNDLFVVAEYRRQGIAEQMLHTIHEFAKAAGASRVTLITEHVNSAAQRLYESLGYKLDLDFRRYSFAL